MDIHKKYVVYEMNRVMGNKSHLALEKVYFDYPIYNSFDTENDAVQALIDAGKHYEDYLILLQICIN